MTKKLQIPKVLLFNTNISHSFQEVHISVRYVWSTVLASCAYSCSLKRFWILAVQTVL